MSRGMDKLRDPREDSNHDWFDTAKNKAESVLASKGLPEKREENSEFCSTEANLVAKGANEMHDLFTQAIAKQQVVFDKMLEALREAKEFISNGIEFGYIQMPDIKTDSANKTLPQVKQAIKAGEEFGR